MDYDTAVKLGWVEDEGYPDEMMQAMEDHEYNDCPIMEDE